MMDILNDILKVAVEIEMLQLYYVRSYTAHADSKYCTVSIAALTLTLFLPALLNTDIQLRWCSIMEIIVTIGFAAFQFFYIGSWFKATHRV